MTYEELFDNIVSDLSEDEADKAITALFTDKSADN